MAKKTLISCLRASIAENDVDKIQEYANAIINRKPALPESLRAVAFEALRTLEAEKQIAAPSFSSIGEGVYLRVMASGYFDHKWYLEQYRSKLTGLPSHSESDLAVHYLETGWKQGLNPGPEFHTNFYLDQYPDIKENGIIPLYHYVAQGKKEGRLPCPLPADEDAAVQRKADNQYVGHNAARNKLFRSSEYRTVAFYLPQFHAIPENDKWWGRGFTEWTNVAPAKPLFNDHYQPHKPGELGDYRLDDVSVLKRQVSLAKSYGLDAFCFYFYWFNGKTLLEKPLELFLGNPSLDREFCLCWANENWTRRWDGKENDILIGQEYSESDDIDFIVYISKYLRDERYLRIEGKPVLLIYRASLLPDPKATTQRWRQWCRDNGIGELHLVYTQSFECAHPLEYGCDAGTEFAPNIPIGHIGATPTLVTDKVEGVDEDFKGKIFDWLGYIKRSEQLPHPGYPIYRCINPGWDNTARKKLNSTIFVNSSPRNFQKWSLNALKDTAFAQGQNGLMFINAWNEWAEGAHLEPDQKYGYGYLEALRMSRARFNAIQRIKASQHEATLEPSSIALIVHAFYPEILNEIIEYQKSIEQLSGAWLIVTTPEDKVEACKQVINEQASSLTPLIIATENHGRDILPFIKNFDLIMRLGIKVFCKLHTKKSKHRSDGDSWRQELYSGLLDKDKIPKVLAALNSDSGVGIVLPNEHILKITSFLGSNLETVARLSARVGTPLCHLHNLPLVAGSMFWGRMDALVPMYLLSKQEEFESEKGQVDGTFAHALERMFSISADSVELSVCDMDLVAYTPESEETDYLFANKG